MLYRFPGEAPHPLFIENYEKCIFTSFPTIEQELSHRNCIIFFKDDDLYILEKSYQPQIIPQTIKANIFILPDSFVSIDFETLYAQRVSACSVGLVKYKDGKQVDHYYSLIRPPFEYEGKKGFALTHIHGFREEDLVSERTMESILLEIEKFVGDLPLVAHNASVEKGCLRDTIAFYGLKTNLEYEKFFDTLYLSKDIEKQLGIYEEGEGTHTLDAVCRRFGVCEQHHHNALDDAEMCGNLILAFKAALENGHVVKKDFEQQPDPMQQNNEPQEESGIISFFKKLLITLPNGTR
jgi:DNA polymerase-3 subunit epsilon